MLVCDLENILVFGGLCMQIIRLLSALVQQNLPRAKLKSYGLTALAHDISRQPSIDCAL